MSSLSRDIHSHNYGSKGENKSRNKHESKNSSTTTHRRKHKHRSHKIHTRKSYSKHQESAAHHRLEDDLPNLRKHRYFIRHLQVSIEKNAKHNFLSRLTPLQIAYLRRELVTHPRVMTSRSELKRFVSEIVTIFDQALYYGALERCITKIRVYTREDEDGGFSKAYFDLEKNELCVNIDALFNGKSGGDTYDYAAVVVHEMLHGFYSNFSCKCAFCTRRARKSVNGSDGNGSSHGPLFLTAMRQIEWVLQREFVNGERKFDCHIRDSLRLEMRKSRWQPRKDQFERWGVEYCELGDEAVDGWEDMVPDEEEGGFNLLGAWGGDRTCVCAVM